MLKVWGRTNSSNVMKVLWLLDELGLAFERIDAGLAFGRNDTDAYRAMSPFGLIPVLQDGPVTLFESNTILRFVCRVHAPESPLYPKDHAPRSHVESWMDAQLGTMVPLGVVFQQLIRLSPEHRDSAMLGPALERSRDAFAVLNGHLATRQWLAGDGLTLADIAYGPLVHRWFALPIERSDAPDLAAYYQRLLARPAYVARCAGKLS